MEKIADRVTLRNIAAIAGVAPSTVYRALAGKEGVSEQTRERIVHLAQQLGFVPPAGTPGQPGVRLSGEAGRQTGAAPPGRAGQQLNIPAQLQHVNEMKRPPGSGLAITLIIDARSNPFLQNLADNPFYLELIAGISEASQVLSYRLSIEIIASDDDLPALLHHIVPGIDWKRTTSGEIVRADRRRALPRLFGRGIVWLGYQPRDGYIPWIPVLARLGVPVVLCDHYVNDLPCDAVVSDNIGGARELGVHVAGLGHRRVCILRQALPSAASWERTLGFQAALYEAGLATNDIHIIDAAPTFEGGYETLPQALASGATAILCGNDMMAVGVLRRAAELGVRIPESLSVCGFDDITTSGRLTPALTTARVDRRAIGREALHRIWALSQLALARLTGEGPDGEEDGALGSWAGSRVVVPVRLVVRETTGHAPGMPVVAASAVAADREE